MNDILFPAASRRYRQQKSRFSQRRRSPSPLWTLPNVLVSPHMAGDTIGWHDELAGLFLDNLGRYRDGRPLVNVVDKKLGYVTRGT